MPLEYDLLLPQQTAFGWGRFTEAGTLARSLGSHALVISGSRHLESAGVLERLQGLLEDAEVTSQILGHARREPRVHDVDSLIPPLRASIDAHDQERTLVIGIGGGAALDLAKALSAMATNRHFESVRDGLEGVGQGYAIEQRPLPMLAIPTTAGTGSECTKNSVISSNDDDEKLFKKSLRSNQMVPDIVLVDPQLGVSVPPEITAFTGMDAITQLIESASSCRARPVTTALAMHGLELGAGQLERAVLEPDNREAREAMSHAAYLSGIALANSGLGMAHGVAPALGILADVPHGLACAIMLPAALEANRSVRAREIATLARLLTGREFSSDDEAARAAPEAVLELQSRIGISPKLSDHGVTREQIPAIVAGSRGNSMSGNPRAIEDDELTEILERMF